MQFRDCRSLPRADSTGWPALAGHDSLGVFHPHAAGIFVARWLTSSLERRAFSASVRLAASSISDGGSVASIARLTAGRASIAAIQRFTLGNSSRSILRSL